jgi:2'-5' RNA ligase
MSKYLISLQVPKSLDDDLDRIGGYQKPSSGYHITLCLFNEDLSTYLENKIIKIVNGVEINNFKLSFRGYDTFDKGRIVLRVSENKIIRDIHYKIIKNIEGLDINVDKKYFLKNYSPHITIAKRTIIENYSVVGPLYEFSKITFKKKDESWKVLV